MYGILYNTKFVWVTHFSEDSVIYSCHVIWWITESSKQSVSLNPIPTEAWTLLCNKVVNILFLFILYSSAYVKSLVNFIRNNSIYWNG